MGRSPCCDESTGLKKGPWSPDEDQKLIKYVQKHGHGSWRALPKLAGLNRCGKSCRLRWNNYLRPDIKRGKFSPEEEQTIVRLHSIIGNKWSTIATHLPGRTDNEIKNFWNTNLRKKLLHMGIDPTTHRPRTDRDLLATLPQLVALASLGDIIGVQAWSDHVVRLQEEASKLVKLQCLQYLLQSSETSGSDVSVSNLISSASSTMAGVESLHATVLPTLTSMSSPGVLASFSSPETLIPVGSDIKQDSTFGTFQPEGSCDPSTFHASDGSLAASLGACSSDGSFDSFFWPDQLIVEENLLI